MKRWEAARFLLEAFPEALTVVANGFISREAFELCHKPANFYMIGSMGLAGPIGLGIAVSQPNRRVLVLDGDGNILCNLGALTMISEIRPDNFIHVALDNECYESTGGQRAISNNVSLSKIALAAGYEHVISVTTEDELLEAVNLTSEIKGPIFIHIKVEADRLKSARRVEPSPEEITRSFTKEATHIVNIVNDLNSENICYSS